MQMAFSVEGYEIYLFSYLSLNLNQEDSQN